MHPDADGIWVDKTLQPGDRKKLKDGATIARSILKAAGAPHIFKSWHFAAHAPQKSVGIAPYLDLALSR